MLLRLSSTRDNARGPQYMEQALAAIHQANGGRLPFSLLLAHSDSQTSLFCRFRPELAAILEGQLAASYPDSKIERLPEHALRPSPDHRLWTMDLTLRPDLFPIRRYQQFEDLLSRNTSDPLTGIFAALAPGKRKPLAPTIKITVRPAALARSWFSRRAVRRLSSPFFRSHPTVAKAYALGVTSRWFLVRILTRILGTVVPSQEPETRNEQLVATSPSRAHDRENDLQGALDKLGRHLFEVSIRLSVSAPENLASAARARLRQMAGSFGQFTVPRLGTFRVSRIRCGNRRFRRRGFLLSCEELATLWHPATETVRAASMQRNESRELEAPANIPTIPGVLGAPVFSTSYRGVNGSQMRHRRAVAWCHW